MPGATFSATDDGTGNVHLRCSRSSGGKYEGAKRREILVISIDLRFDVIHLCFDDTKRLMWRVIDDRGAKVGTDIEEVILDSNQERSDLIRDLGGCENDTDRRIRFIDGGICLKSRIVLRGTRAVTERSGAIVTSLGIDTCQIDHVASLFLWSRVSESTFLGGARLRWKTNGLQGVRGRSFIVTKTFPDKFRITGGAQLRGDVEVSGAKNSVLKLMAASLLAPGKTTLENVPDIADVGIMSELLTRLGCTITRDLKAASIEIDVPSAPSHRADYDLVRKMRASINVLGPLVARCGEAEVALPGGDAIGSRGLDYHIKGLIEMGAKIHNEHGYVIAEAPSGLQGATISLDFPSVGATENIMTAAVLAHGTTILDNAAREPDVVDLGEFLVAMGADIEGLGTPTITIRGVVKLTPVRHQTIPDRIVTGTWAFAAAITRGDITIHRCNPAHLEVPLEKLTSAGAVVTTTSDGVRVRMEKRPRAIDVSTLPYPGFPTDLQPFIITMNAIADGDAIVTENVFESRFIFVNELLRLGAQVKVDGHHAATHGIEMLSSAPVVATDIRAGAGLVIAALVADGITLVEGGFHIDRGYPYFAEQLRSLGADVTRIE